MAQLHATVRLRPTRIGFLAKPTDRASILRIMTLSTCFWGGALNPIIPVGRSTPAAWSREPLPELSPQDIARGYVRFFEPDVFVESSPGLLARIGLGELANDSAFHAEAAPLKDLLARQDRRDWAELAFGLPVVDVLRDQYDTEQRFVLRHPRPAIQVRPIRGSLAAEAIFGCYPADPAAAYFEQGYRDVFQPEEIACGPEAWLKVFRGGAVSPLTVTAHKLNKRRYWYHEPVVFVFDPANVLDVIDLWNLRLEPAPVLPVPIDWIHALAPTLQELFRNDHRPLPGNTNGVMQHTTVEFARSLSDEVKEAAIATLTQDVPAGAVIRKDWRTEVWRESRERLMKAPELMQVTCEEATATLAVKEGLDRTVTVQTIAPAFASKTGGNPARWINVVRLGSYGRHDLGLTLPFNTFHRQWPRLHYAGGERTAVGREGWAFKQRYGFADITIQLPTMETVLYDHLKHSGVIARPSEPGRIAKQMLQRLDGLWGVRLLRDPRTLQLLNRMAGSQRLRMSGGEVIEETFPDRTASLAEWKALAKRRSSHFNSVDISEFTDRGVIRVGLESRCPHCDYKNWSGLDVVAYSLKCERCLNGYDFPQGRIAKNNESFRYRVVGPFAVPDYGRGSYATLLALDVLAQLGGSTGSDLTYAGATLLTVDERALEADFLALKNNGTHDQVGSPQLIIGECKSFGAGPLVKADDLEKLKVIANRLPGAVIVVAVLKEGFLPEEVARLRKFVGWARRPDGDGYATNPVVLLTGHELFSGNLIYDRWKKLGAPFAAYADFRHTADLASLAEATQAIYLDMPPYWEWWEARQKRRRKTAETAA